MTALLGNRVIAVPESRASATFAAMLQAHGASVLCCPLMGILDAPNAALIDEWLGRLCAEKMDDLIFLTGEGVQRLMGFAARSGKAAAVHEEFRRARKFTRGPKPARALTDLGLRTDMPSCAPTTDGVIETLKRFDLRGRTIGVQLYGEDPNRKLIDYLDSAGAITQSVAPYIYAPATHDQQVIELIEQMADGAVDVLAFTAAGQVRRLMEVAATHHHEVLLEKALTRTRVGAVGPIVAEELERQKIRVDIIPDKSFILRQFVNDIASAMQLAESVNRPAGFEVASR